MTPSEFEQLEEKLDVLIKIMAMQAMEGRTVAEGAPLLNRIGMAPKDIADVFATTPGTVSVRLSEAKSNKTKGK